MGPLCIFHLQNKGFTNVNYITATDQNLGAHGTRHIHVVNHTSIQEIESQNSHQQFLLKAFMIIGTELWNKNFKQGRVAQDYNSSEIWSSRIAKFYLGLGYKQIKKTWKISKAVKCVDFKVLGVTSIWNWWEPDLRNLFCISCVRYRTPTLFFLKLLPFLLSLAYLIVVDSIYYTILDSHITFSPKINSCPE